MSDWTEDYTTPEQYEIVQRCCRGKYQRNLVAGIENLSGSTLRGRAKEYGRHYEASRYNLLERIRAAGVPVSEYRGPHGRRILVIGSAT